MSSTARICAVSLGVLLAACDQTSGVPFAPIGRGTLEVSLDVLGGKPDPDGYTVTLVGHDGAPVAAHLLGVGGGVVGFTDLEPGSYTVRIDSAAGNCSLPDDVLVARTVRRTETVHVQLTIYCPGAGGLRIVATTIGDHVSLDPYAVEMSSFMRLYIGANDSLLVREQDLPPAESWLFQLSGVPSNCQVMAPSPFPFTLRPTGDSVVEVHLSIACTARLPGQDSGFWRVTPHSSATLAYHGSLAEVLFFVGGRFTLTLASANWGTLNYPGTYRQTGDILTLSFADPSWSATATQRDGCIAVSYNIDMQLSDFEDGTYCQR